MKRLAFLCAGLGTPAIADVITCDMSGTPVSFEIDHAQFSPPLIKGEPPRRQVTTVQMGDAQFPAEPILMGDVRGFWAEGFAGSNVMLVMQTDGSATYTDTRAGQRLDGMCEVLK